MRPLTPPRPGRVADPEPGWSALPRLGEVARRQRDSLRREALVVALLIGTFLAAAIGLAAL